MQTSCAMRLDSFSPSHLTICPFGGVLALSSSRGAASCEASNNIDHPSIHHSPAVKDISST
jgi:hypothetical protein